LIWFKCSLISNFDSRSWPVVGYFMGSHPNHFKNFIFLVLKTEKFVDSLFLRAAVTQESRFFTYLLFRSQYQGLV
jgi:hypothetical protein